MNIFTDYWRNNLGEGPTSSGHLNVEISCEEIKKIPRSRLWKEKLSDRTAQVPTAMILGSAQTMSKNHKNVI